jgi:hypothetical protein
MSISPLDALRAERQVQGKQPQPCSFYAIDTMNYDNVTLKIQNDIFVFQSNSNDACSLSDSFAWSADGAIDAIIC